MKKIYQKIDRIRGSGMATLNLNPSSEYYHLNGKRFPVESVAKPDIKCRVTLIVNNALLDFTIDEVL